MLPTNTAGLPIIPVTPPSSIVMLQKRVMLVLPWGKHTNPISAYAVAQLQDRRRVTTALNWGDAFVAHSRNSCADLFLASDKEWMLTIDDDMIVPFGNAEWYNAHTRFNFSEKFAGLNALDRLLSHGKTLVGALYFGRYPGSSLGMGEDVQFCIRAQEAGHQPHVDMGLIAGHIGHCVFGPKNTGIKPVK
jgi:hypothetical protein